MDQRGKNFSEFLQLSVSLTSLSLIGLHAYSELVARTGVGEAAAGGGAVLRYC